ncbi:MAG: CPBP family intramembrane metalloprotease [Clostridiales bacterium]|nr:CPBP family intramembrane metalloprotease [Clostridiales bacterium]
MGASVGNALRSGFMGIALYILGCFVIHILPSRPRPLPACDQRTKSRGLFGSLFTWMIVIFLILTVNALYANGLIGFRVPLWGAITQGWARFVNAVAQRSQWISGTGLIGLPNLVLYTLVPSLILLIWRSKFPAVWGLRASVPALPFVAVYAVGFIVIRGISASSAITLLIVLLWPAFGEEFLWRGVVQSTLAQSVRRPVSAIALTSFLFAASHIPAYLWGYYEDPLLALSGLLSLLPISFFWGYGYHRTGVLWPFVLIHALSDLVQF